MQWNITHNTMLHVLVCGLHLKMHQTIRLMGSIGPLTPTLVCSPISPIVW